MKRLAMVGAGQRAAKYLEVLATAHRNDCELAAICDVSLAMLETKRAELSAHGNTPR